MKLPRRKFLQIAAASALSAPPSVAIAQAYPRQPVRWMVAFPAGGPVDAMTRIIGQRLADKLQQPFIIENEIGGGRNVAAEIVAHAPADGYTLLLIDVTNAVNATVYTKLNFDFVRDIAPVAGIVRTPFVMEVGPSFPVKTVAEFTAYARANPGKIKMASGGIGSPTHLCGEMFKITAGVDLLHVPYGLEGPALVDLKGGQIQVMFGVLPVSFEHIKTGEIRALAVTSEMRSDALPDVPTVGETIAGFEATQWYGLGVPKGTPSEVVNLLNKEIGAALADPVLRPRIVGNGTVAFSILPTELMQLISMDIEKWGRVARVANVKLD